MRGKQALDRRWRNRPAARRAMPVAGGTAPRAPGFSCRALAVTLAGGVLLGGLLAAGPAPAAPLTVERLGGDYVVRFAPGDVTLTEHPAGIEAGLRSVPDARRVPGTPSLPRVPVTVEIPVDQTAAALQVQIDEQVVARGVTLVEAAVPRGDDDPSPAPPRRAARDRGIAPLPAAVARLAGEGFARGHRLLTIDLAPLRWVPATGALRLATTIRLHLELERTANRPLERYRTVPQVEARYERAMRAAIGAPPPPQARPAPPAGGGAEPFVPSFPPSTDGSPVKFVIVTNDAMKLEFQLLANWRTQMGLQSVVRTIEWIQGFYPNGADRAEQLRFFLQDAYQNWGTLWVLLAGDTEILPPRYATSLVQTTPDDPESIPTDLYFACLDGNWNGDKDDRIGEGWISIEDPGDDADLVPELFVGRVPVSSSQEATDYVNKLLDYERLTPVDAAYPASMLFLAEDLGSADGAVIAEDVMGEIHPWMKVVRLYENWEQFPGSLPLTKDAALDSIDTGFGWVHHVGHGFRNTMHVADGSISNPDADLLANGDRQSFVFAINCSSASIDFNSIGERWVKNANGGAVGYVGTTRQAFAQVSRRYQNEFYRLAFADSIPTAGECLFMSRLPWAAPAGAENFDRWTQLALILLGDPALPLWTNTPEPLAAAHDSTLTLGSGSFTVTALNGAADPVPGAQVTLWAIAEDYETGLTDPAGQVTLSFDPETTGTFLTTVTRRNFLPYEAAVPVAASAAPYVFIEGVSIDDDNTGASFGNGDGVVDAGETVELAIGLHNSGQQAATGVAATLTVEAGAEHVEVVTGTVTYPDIAPSEVYAADHVVHILPTAPHGFLPRLRVDVTANEGSWNDIFVLPVYTVEMEQYRHAWFDPAPGGNDNGVIEPGETIAYTVELRNNGIGEAMGVTAVLRVLNAGSMAPDPLVTITGGTASYGDLSPTERATGNYGFLLDAAADPDQLLLELTVEDVWDTLAVQLSDLTPPGVADSLRALGSATAITVKWAPVVDGDLLGYDIARASAFEGPYGRINAQTVVGTTFFEDGPLPALTRYYYKIAARDSSFNGGADSQIIAATTNPPLHDGWPIETTQSTTCGVKVADLDGLPGLELVTGSDCIYAWHADGTEVLDGDGDPRSSGVFTLEGCDASNGFRGDPAIVDLDGDGTLEIVISGWGAAAGVGALHVLEPDGSARPGWPQTLDYPFNWGSAAVGQIEPGDNLEIVTVQGQNGVVYAFHADGTELRDGDNDPSTNGPFFELGGAFAYGSPALGDLDGDLLDEIVVAQRSTLGRIYVLDRDGSLLPGWPFETGAETTASPVIAELDGLAPPEIVISSECDSVYVLRADASRFPGWPQPAMINTDTDRTPSPIVVDLDQDGRLDIVVLANDGQLHAWDRDGIVLPGWENVLIAQTELDANASQSTPTAGDVDGDGELELLVGAEDGRLYGFNADGSPLDGFPIQLEGEVRGSATIGDLDGDGLVEVAMAGWDQNVYVWDLPSAFDPALVPWPYFRHDLLNRGNLEGYVAIGVGAEAGPALPQVYRLGRAWPNPFNPRTRFSFEVPQRAAEQPLSLRVVDVLGRTQRTLLAGPLAPGRHVLTWDGRNDGGHALPSGVYFIQAAAPGFEAARKILLLR